MVKYSCLNLKFCKLVEDINSQIRSVQKLVFYFHCSVAFKEMEFIHQSQDFIAVRLKIFELPQINNSKIVQFYFSKKYKRK